MEYNNNSISSVSTNWVVCKGSLDNLITLKTPSITAPGNDGGTKRDHCKHEAVVLNLPCSESNEPCQITVSFAQSHEIRQVYVRSSATTYEIYYGNGQQSSNEYHSRVTCGAVAKPYTAFETNDTEEANSAHFEESTNQMELTEEQINNDNSPTEYGWVEVQVPDSAVVESKTGSLDKKVNKDTERSIQDCYEATEEVADLSPCISLTIRLLSLQTVSCLHLEEIHIIGKPVEHSESDEKVDPMTLSSTIVTLAPTLQQLSEAGMTTGTTDVHIADARQEIKCQDVESLSPYTGRTMSRESQSSLPNREQVKLDEVAKGSPESSRIQSDESVPVTGEGSEFVNQVNVSSPGRIESLLDQLVCRVGRIESFCLRFEENMLKPISNLQTRLEQLEQKVEVLTVKSQSSDLFLCTKICAPDFSCIESETNSYRDDENEATHSGVSFTNKDASFARPPQYVGDESEPSLHLNEFESSVAPHVIPGLVITAPEFSIEDYDDNNDDNNGHCGGDYKTSIATNGKNNRSNLSATKDLKEAPVTITDLNLGALRLGLASTSVIPKANPFGVTFKNNSESLANSPFILREPNGVLLQPASFSLQPSLPANVSALSSHCTVPNPTSSAFGQPAHISDAQQALGSVFGGFGQSRQLGTSLPRPSSGPSVGFSSGGFGAFSNQQGGGGFSAFGGSTARSGEPPSTSGFGNAEFPARTASGGFGFSDSLGNPFGGFANAAAGGFGSRGSTIGGFSEVASGAVGFVGCAGATGGEGSGFAALNNQQGGGGFSAFGGSTARSGEPPSTSGFGNAEFPAHTASGGFGFSDSLGNPFGEFANAVAGGFGSRGSTIGWISEVASGAAGSVGCAGATGGGGSGFEALSNQQGGCGFSACGSNTAGIEKSPSTIQFGTGGFSACTTSGGFGVSGGCGTPIFGGFSACTTSGGFGVDGRDTPTSGGFANAATGGFTAGGFSGLGECTGPAGGISGFDPFSNQKEGGGFSETANRLAGKAKAPPELFTHMRK